MERAGGQTALAGRGDLAASDLRRALDAGREPFAVADGHIWLRKQTERGGRLRSRNGHDDPKTARLAWLLDQVRRRLANDLEWALSWMERNAPSGKRHPGRRQIHRSASPFDAGVAMNMRAAMRVRGRLMSRRRT